MKKRTPNEPPTSLDEPIRASCLWRLPSFATKPHRLLFYYFWNYMQQDKTSCLLFFRFPNSKNANYSHSLSTGSGAKRTPTGELSTAAFFFFRKRKRPIFRRNKPIGGWSNIVAFYFTFSFRKSGKTQPQNGEPMNTSKNAEPTNQPKMLGFRRFRGRARRDLCEII